MNKAILIGRIGKDLELRTSQSGNSFLTFPLAVSGNNSEGKTTYWINIKSFGKTSEFISKYFSKGNLIAIEGKIATGKYDKEGKTIYTTDVIAEKVYFTGEKRSESYDNMTQNVSSNDEFLILDESDSFIF